MPELLELAIALATLSAFSLCATLVATLYAKHRKQQLLSKFKEQPDRSIKKGQQS